MFANNEAPVLPNFRTKVQVVNFGQGFNKMPFLDVRSPKCRLKFFSTVLSGANILSGHIELMFHRELACLANRLKKNCVDQPGRS